MISADGKQRSICPLTDVVWNKVSPFLERNRSRECIISDQSRKCVLGGPASSPKLLIGTFGLKIYDPIAQALHDRKRAFFGFVKEDLTHVASVWLKPLGIREGNNSRAHA